jgi:hypothetical protein
VVRKKAAKTFFISSLLEKLLAYLRAWNYSPSRSDKHTDVANYFENTFLPPHSPASAGWRSSIAEAYM